MAASRKKQWLIVRMGLGLVLIASLFLAGPAPRVHGQNATIDSFDSLSGIEVTLGGNPKSGADTLDDPEVFGGERDIYVTRTQGNQTVSGISDDSLSEYTHSQAAGTRAISWVTWDGPDDDASPSSPDLTNLDIDLEGEGATGFQVWIVKVDITGGVLRINLWDIEGDQATISDNLGAVEFPGETRTYLFADFTEDASFDRDHVAAIQLEIDGTAEDDLDVRIDWIAFNGPTAVDVTGFSATSTLGHMLVAWETGSEVNLQGFNLHRGETADGVYTELNPTVIPAQNHGQPIGAAYSWLDEDVVPGGTYYYKLEALEDGGLTTFFGPVSARAVHSVYLPLLVRE